MYIFRDKSILLGVTGGIAAYKAAEVTSRLAQAGAEVTVIMTQHATEFVAPLTFQSLSGREVITDMFARPEAYGGVRHISLAEQAAAILVAPATANVIGKVATGLADDMLTTTILAATCPVVFVPAMNDAMFRNPIVQRNLATLAGHGYVIVPPGEGWLACRRVGKGRFPEIDTVLQALAMAVCEKKDLRGRRVLVTAGPTREYFDPVRYVTNPSSGKMGHALALAAAQRGAAVTLITGPTALPDPFGVETVRVESTAEMYAAVLERAAEQDVFLGAAAPVDYAPAERAAQKLKKAEQTLTMELRPTPDILAEVGRRNLGRVRVGFAAETTDLLAHAQAKLEKKNLHLIVANDLTRPGAGFQADTNAVTLLGRDGTVEELPLMGKDELAHHILDRVARLLD
jgi:phosphopantothenoylcysteine decarboxylase/phosphopantothenate--cysteine ligase